MSNFNVVAVDYVEQDTWEGKPYLKLTDKQGNTWRLGKHLADKYDSILALESGTPVKLTMATFVKDGEEKEYVKNIEKAMDAVATNVAAKLAPQKNAKDISIEAQVSVRAVVDLMIAEISVPEDIQTMAMEWMRNSLKEATNGHM